MAATELTEDPLCRVAGNTVHCAGAWTLPNAERIDDALAAIAWPAGRVHLELGHVSRLDTAGAWLLHRTVQALERDGREVVLEGLRSEAQPLLELVHRRAPGGESMPPVPAHPGWAESVGRNAAAFVEQAVGLHAFIGEIAVTTLAHLRGPSRMRWGAMLRNLEAAGCNALPIIGLLSFLLGVVMAYQGGVQLRAYGANVYVVDLVGLTMLRELAPMMTAVIVAGRTGSAYTAEIGTMQVNEEIDAMRTLGIAPMDALVLPKLMALIIALPLLTVYADILGLLGGMVMASAMFNVDAALFLERLPEAVSARSYLIGIGKAPVFAALIAAVGCYQGFRVAGSPESVGRQTTVSVVQAIFLVIVTDAVFSIIFSGLGI